MPTQTDDPTTRFLRRVKRDSDAEPRPPLDRFEQRRLDREGMATKLVNDKRAAVEQATASVHARIAEADERIRDLEREIGVAEVDDRKVAPATSKQLQDARAERERIVASLDVVAERAGDEVAREAHLGAARRRLGEYQWAAEWYKTAADTIAVANAAADGLDRLGNLQFPRRVANYFDPVTGATWSPGMNCEPYDGRRDFHSSPEDLDVDASVLALAERKRNPEALKLRGKLRDMFGVTAEQLHELEAHARERIAEAEAEIEKLEQQGSAA